MAPLIFGAVFSSPKAKWQHGKVCFPTLMLWRRAEIRCAMSSFAPWSTKNRERHTERKQGRLKKYLNLVRVLGLNKGDVPWVRTKIWLQGLEVQW